MISKAYHHFDNSFLHYERVNVFQLIYMAWEVVLFLKLFKFLFDGIFISSGMTSEVMS